MSDCVSIPPTSSRKFPIMIEGSWRQVTAADLDNMFTNRHDLVVRALFSGERDSDDVVSYYADLAEIHYCVHPYMGDDNLTMLATYDVLIAALRKGYLTTFRNLAAIYMQLPDTLESNRKMIKHELKPVKEAIKAVRDGKSLASIKAQYPDSLVAQLPDSGGEGECKILKRPRRELLDISEDTIPDLALNTAAKLHHICVHVEGAIAHVSRLQLHMDANK